MNKKFSDIIESLGKVNVCQRGKKRVINKITFDSREVKEGDLFFCIKGTVSDGHKYINEVVEKGAVGIVCEKLPKDLKEKVTYIQVESSSAALALAASCYYEHPSKKINLVGVTGTNGKTSIATLCFELARMFDKKAGLISTIEYKINDEIFPSSHTTPDPIKINQLLSEMLEKGCEYCFMEVSSHAIKQNRIEGLTFEGGAFTNLTQDHLDYHKTFKDYLYTKKRFFDNLPKEAFALINIDDKNAGIMSQNCNARIVSYSMLKPAEIKTKVKEESFDGMLLEINSRELFIQLVGRFNVYNLMAVYGIFVNLGFDRNIVLRFLSTLKSIEGRFEVLRNADGVSAIVDYAHTPDALKNVLKTIRSVRRRNQRIIAVCGAGGDRDRGKRAEMGNVAYQYADLVVLTSDNPRSEEPMAIIKEMAQDIKKDPKEKLVKIADRREAIKLSKQLANPKDIILIAGKGHEKYQEIKGVRYPFDDKEELKKLNFKK